MSLPRGSAVHRVHGVTPNVTAVAVNVALTEGSQVTAPGPQTLTTAARPSLCRDEEGGTLRRQSALALRQSHHARVAYRINRDTRAGDAGRPRSARERCVWTPPPKPPPTGTSHQAIAIRRLARAGRTPTMWMTTGPGTRFKAIALPGLSPLQLIERYPRRARIAPRGWRRWRPDRPEVFPSRRPESAR